MLVPHWGTNWERSIHVMQISIRTISTVFVLRKQHVPAGLAEGADTYGTYNMHYAYFQQILSWITQPNIFILVQVCEDW